MTSHHVSIATAVCLRRRHNRLDKLFENVAAVVVLRSAEVVASHFHMEMTCVTFERSRVRREHRKRCCKHNVSSNKKVELQLRKCQTDARK